MEIITGYVGKPHVTSEQDRDVHIGMIGSGSYVLQTGKQMAAEISSNNEIKVRDGVLMHQGCAASIKKNTYDSLSIVNGSQGMKRIDLIVARYERNENTGVESLTLKVLKGTQASANPATPAYTTGDIQAGDYIADMPMYKVTLDGINITKLEKQFQTVETNATLTQKVNELNSTSIKETGSSKGWIYRKWCDGTVELWWNSNVTYSNSVGAGVTGLTLASVDIPLPFTISNGMAVASATWNFSEWAQASIDTKSATHVTVRKFGNANSQNQPVQGVYIYVRGTI